MLKDRNNDVKKLSQADQRIILYSKDNEYISLLPDELKSTLQEFIKKAEQPNKKEVEDNEESEKDLDDCEEEINSPEGRQ